MCDSETQGPLRSFPQYGRLPREIRHKIWLCAIPGPQVMEPVASVSPSGFHISLHRDLPSAVRAVPAVCWESRYVFEHLAGFRRIFEPEEWRAPSGRMEKVPFPSLWADTEGTIVEPHHPVRQSERREPHMPARTTGGFWFRPRADTLWLNQEFLHNWVHGYGFLRNPGSAAALAEVERVALDAHSNLDADDLPPPVRAALPPWMARRHDRPQRAAVLVLLRRLFRLRDLDGFEATATTAAASALNTPFPRLREVRLFEPHLLVRCHETAGHRRRDGRPRTSLAMRETAELKRRPVVAVVPVASPGVAAAAAAAEMVPLTRVHAAGRDWLVPSGVLAAAAAVGMIRALQGRLRARAPVRDAPPRVVPCVVFREHTEHCVRPVLVLSVLGFLVGDWWPVRGRWINALLDAVVLHGGLVTTLFLIRKLVWFVLRAVVGGNGLRALAGIWRGLQLARYLELVFSAYVGVQWVRAW